MVANARITANATAHGLDVGAQLFSEAGDLVHKADLGGQHGVGGVLGQLSAFHIHHHNLVAIAVEGCVQFTQLGFGGRVAGADDDAVRALAVADRRTFLEEFGVGHHIKRMLRATRCQTFCNDGHNLVGRTHGHGGLVDHDARPVHMLGNGAGHGQHILQVRAAVFIRRRAHGQKNQFAMRHTFCSICGELQAAQLLVVDDKGIKAGFVNGNLPSLESRNFLLIHIHTKHLMADIGQHGTLHQSDIAGSKNSDFHTR